MMPSPLELGLATAFALVAIAPMLLLAWKNARAIPAGLFLFMILAAVPFGWVVFMLSMKDLFQGLVYVATVAFLAFISVRFAAAEIGQRIAWSAVSTFAWGWAFYWGMLATDTIKTSIGFKRSIAERRAEDAEVARKRAILEADPTKRPAVLAERISSYISTNKPFLERARYVTFGDPAKDPNHVTLWAILSLTERQRFDVFNHEVKRLFTELNFWLRREGYMWIVAVGAANASDIAAAGGDSAYFGRDGENVAPQWPANTPSDTRNEPNLPPLQPPQRLK
jgi:hypothetical protein